MFTWREGATANRATRLTELPWEGYLLIRFFRKRIEAFMLDRVARLPGAPCLLARGTRLGGVAFCHVNGSCRAIPANRGEINHENMAAGSDIFVVTICQCYLPNRMKVNRRYQCNRRVSDREQPVQEAEMRWRKVSLVGLLCLAAAQEITHAALSLSQGR